jgi:hypothetical protein
VKDNSKKVSRNTNRCFYTNPNKDTLNFESLNDLIDKRSAYPHSNSYMYFETQIDSQCVSVIRMKDDYGQIFQLFCKERIDQNVKFIYGSIVTILINKDKRRSYCVTTPYLKGTKWNAIFVLNDKFLPAFSFKRTETSDVIMEKYVYNTEGIRVLRKIVELDSALIAKNYKEISFDLLDSKIKLINLKEDNMDHLQELIDKYFLVVPIWIDPSHHYPKKY